MAHSTETHSAVNLTKDEQEMLAKLLKHPEIVDKIKEIEEKERHEK